MYNAYLNIYVWLAKLSVFLKKFYTIEILRRLPVQLLPLTKSRHNQFCIKDDSTLTFFYSTDSTSSCAASRTNSDFDTSRSFGLPPRNLRLAEPNQIASPHGVLRSLNSERISLTTLRGRAFSSRT